MNYIEMHKELARRNENRTFDKATAVVAMRELFSDPNLKLESNVGFNWYCGGSADNSRRPVLAVQVTRGTFRVLPESEWLAASGSKTRASVASAAPVDPFSDVPEVIALRQKLAEKANRDAAQAEIDRLTALLETDSASN